MSDQVEEWISLQEAGDLAGCTSEGVRLWTLGDEPQVARRDTLVGKRKRVLVARSDVERCAALRRRRVASPSPVRTAAVDQGSLTDRATVLEEIVHRRQLIDEYREQIEERHSAIVHEHREIERLLLGPSQVPTN